MAINTEEKTLKKKMLILDFDGPVVTSYEGAFKVTQMVWPHTTPQNFRERFMHNIHLVPEHLTVGPKNESVNFDFEYNKYIMEMDLCPSRHSALVRLAAHYHFHVVSGTHSDTLNAFFEKHQVKHLFDDVLGHDFSKSKVERFEYLFEKHKVAPEHASFVTDTAGDIFEAKRVAMGTIVAVLDGFHEEERLIQAGPHYYIPSLSHLPDLLLGNRALDKK